MIQPISLKAYPRRLLSVARGTSPRKIWPRWVHVRVRRVDYRVWPGGAWVRDRGVDVRGLGLAMQDRLAVPWVVTMPGLIALQAEPSGIAS